MLSFRVGIEGLERFIIDHGIVILANTKVALIIGEAIWEPVHVLQDVREDFYRVT